MQDLEKSKGGFLLVSEFDNFEMPAVANKKAEPSGPALMCIDR